MGLGRFAPIPATATERAPCRRWGYPMAKKTFTMTAEFTIVDLDEDSLKEEAKSAFCKVEDLPGTSEIDAGDMRRLFDDALIDLGELWFGTGMYAAFSAFKVNAIEEVPAATDGSS